ncbi:MAG: hypothetical protein CME68_04550 [Halobacteriovoraceae bacterium]|nr:hypothetical protein [Halobacteriovoraceae bacterium]|tara:strand:+ start:361 stop:795 length:435 start_codon:yes stop_codon:yes gene_type:complete
MKTKLKPKFLLHLFLFISSFLFSCLSFGSLTLNLGVVHKRGLDKSLTLVSEVYSREEVTVGQRKSISLNHGMVLTIKLNFLEPSEVYGPSKRIVVTANLNLKSGEIFQPKSSETFSVGLGEIKTVTYEKGKDQQIEISIQPKII